MSPADHRKNKTRLRPRSLLAGAAGAAAVALGLALAGPGAAQAPANLAPVTFTEAQVAAGRSLAMDNCTGCHGGRLRGLDAPQLIGPLFEHWYTGPVAALFGYIQATMPADRPGTLTGRQTASIVAFLLQGNGFAPGAVPLAEDMAALMGVGFRQ